jgi:hypothetical protein
MTFDEFVEAFEKTGLPGNARLVLDDMDYKDLRYEVRDVEQEEERGGEKVAVLCF